MAARRCREASACGRAAPSEPNRGRLKDGCPGLRPESHTSTGVTLPSREERDVLGRRAGGGRVRGSEEYLEPEGSTEPARRRPKGSVRPARGSTRSLEGLAVLRVAGERGRRLQGRHVWED